MSGRTTLYTFSIEGMEGTVNIVAYNVTDAEDTLKEWLNPGVEIKLLHKDKVTLGKEYGKLNTQDTPAIEDTIKNIGKKIKELEDKRAKLIIEELYK